MNRRSFVQSVMAVSALLVPGFSWLVKKKRNPNPFALMFTCKTLSIYKVVENHMTLNDAPFLGYSEGTLLLSHITWTRHAYGTVSSEYRGFVTFTPLTDDHPVNSGFDIYKRSDFTSACRTLGVDLRTRDHA